MNAPDPDEMRHLALITRLLDAPGEIDVFDDEDMSLICMPDPDQEDDLADKGARK